MPPLTEVSSIRGAVMIVPGPAAVMEPPAERMTRPASAVTSPEADTCFSGSAPFALMTTLPLAAVAVSEPFAPMATLTGVATGAPSVPPSVPTLPPAVSFSVLALISAVPLSWTIEPFVVIVVVPDGLLIVPVR